MSINISSLSKYFDCFYSSGKEKKTRKETISQGLCKGIELLRFLIFICFFFFSLRLIVVFLVYTPGWMKPIGYLCIVAGCIISWVNPMITLYVFIALVPFISGIKNISAGLEQFSFIKSAPILSLVFSIIYLAWIGRRVVYEKKGLLPKSSVGNMVDILSGMVILSMFASSLNYPASVVWENFLSLQVLGQDDPFWFFHAGYIFLQGLFFYRVMETELSENNNEKLIIFVFYMHAIIIIVFSVFQLFFKIPINEFGALNSPFDDIHSYGSYVLLCFFILFYTSISKKYIPGLIFSSFLLLFVIFSASAATLFTLIIMSIILLSFKYRSFRFVSVLIIILPLIFFSNILLPRDNKLNHPILNRYLERFSADTAFKRLGGRAASADQALGMIKDYPITGSGIGTFYRVSRHYHFFKPLNLNRKENAHNYYLQIAAEMGIIALIIFLSAIILAFRRGCSTSFVDEQKNKLKIGLLVGITAYMITMLTGHPLILSNQQFLFWFAMVALTSLCLAAKENSGLYWFKTRSKPVAGILLAILFLGHAYNIAAREFDTPGFEYGLYKIEKINGKQMRWTKRIAYRRIQAESEIVGIVLSAASYNLSSKPLAVQVFLNEKLIDRVHFFAEGVKPLYYYFPSITDNQIELKTIASNTFNPYKLGLSNDLKRNWEHGVAVSEVNFLKIMPKAGIGFYEWEEAAFRKENENISTAKTMFRYTSMQASIQVRHIRNIEGVNDSYKADAVFLLKCSHPDIFDNPVNVKISGDNITLFETAFYNHKWKQVNLNHDRIHQYDVLTFSVSRSWNPKLTGVSEDSRDLGVAVAMIPQ